MSALRKVLVVDDDPVVGTSFNRVLSDKGYIVITAENGAEALEKLQRDNVDLVFTDIKMPGMSGLDVAEQVRARQPWTPVVIITGYGSKANEERAKGAGVSDFLRKPLSPDMIEQSAAKALREAPPLPTAAPVPTVVAPVAAPAPAEAMAEAAAPAKKRSLIVNMALFLSAPFFGLLYAVLLPFVGIGMLAWVAAEPVFKRPKVRSAARTALRAGIFALQLVTAPLLGLAYVLLAPFVGMAMLAWVATKALTERTPAE